MLLHASFVVPLCWSSLDAGTQGYNITNKRVLNWLPLPWFVAWAQLVFGVVYCVTLWAIKLRKRPVVPQEGVKALSVVALCHTIGHVSTVCSLGAVAVSYVLATSSVWSCFSATGILSVLWPLVCGVPLRIRRSAAGALPFLGRLLGTGVPRWWRNTDVIGLVLGALVAVCVTRLVPAASLTSSSLLSRCSRSRHRQSS